MSNQPSTSDIYHAVAVQALAELYDQVQQIEPRPNRGKFLATVGLALVVSVVVAGSFFLLLAVA